MLSCETNKLQLPIPIEKGGQNGSQIMIRSFQTFNVSKVDLKKIPILKLAFQSSLQFAIKEMELTTEGSRLSLNQDVFVKDGTLNILMDISGLQTSKLSRF
jgi:hypothetical protein